MAAKIKTIIDAFLALSDIDSAFATKLQAPVDPTQVAELPAVAVIIERDGVDEDGEHAGNETYRLATLSCAVCNYIGASKNANEAISDLIKIVEDAWESDRGLGGLIHDRPYGDWQSFWDPKGEGEGQIVGATTEWEVAYHVTDGAY